MRRLTGVLLGVVLICLLSGPALAGDEVLIGGPLDYGGYGGPVLKVAPVKNEAGVFLGGYGGWYINHCFLIGAGAYGLVSEIKAPATGPKGETLYYEMGYAGLVFEYVNNSRRLVHYTVSTLIGAGGLGYKYKISEGDWPFNYADDAFFIIEPDLNVELNVSKHFRVGLGVGYRLLSGLRMEGIANEDLSGAYANLIFKFGSF